MGQYAVATIAPRYTNNNKTTILMVALNQILIVIRIGVMGRSDRKVEASHPIGILDLRYWMQINAGECNSSRQLADVSAMLSPRHAIASLQRPRPGKGSMLPTVPNPYSPNWDSVTTAPPAGAQPKPEV